MSLGRNKIVLSLFFVASIILLLGVVYAQESQPTSRPITGCGPNTAADDKCVIYAISRQNMEKNFPGYTIPGTGPVIPAGATGLPAGITAGQTITSNVISAAVIARLTAQNLPSNPPNSWEDVLAAKRYVMNGIMKSLGKKYDAPTMIDFRGKKPKKTGGNPESRPTTQPSNFHLVFAKLYSFVNLPIASVSAQTPPAPKPIPLVITVYFDPIGNGNYWRHSIFCWATNVNWATGDGHYFCIDHENQGGYFYSLDIKDEKVKGLRIPPYPGPYPAPVEPIVTVTGTLEIIVSHDVP